MMDEDLLDVCRCTLVSLVSLVYDGRGFVRCVSLYSSESSESSEFSESSI